MVRGLAPRSDSSVGLLTFSKEGSHTPPGVLELGKPSEDTHVGTLVP